VEAHGGRIWAENNNAGKDDKEKGATFYFSLPLIKKQKHQPGFREEVSYQQQQQL
jgi:signal transduction histidine kinase